MRIADGCRFRNSVAARTRHRRWYRSWTLVMPFKSVCRRCLKRRRQETAKCCHQGVSVSERVVHYHYRERASMKVIMVAPSPLAHGVARCAQQVRILLSPLWSEARAPIYSSPSMCRSLNVGVPVDPVRVDARRSHRGLDVGFNGKCSTGSAYRRFSRAGGAGMPDSDV